MRKLITLLALLLAFSFSLVAQEAEQDNITEDPEVEVPAEEPTQPENDDEFESKLRIELWVTSKANNLIYRMLVLNTGQISWTLKKQLNS